MLELSSEEIKTTIKVSSRHISVNAPFVDGENNSLLDVLEDTVLDRTDREMNYHYSLQVETEKTLSTLTERERDVVKLFFGISVQNPLTLEDIGDQLGLTRERVRQIKDKALNKLRSTSRSKSLKTYLAQ